NMTLAWGHFLPPEYWDEGPRRADGRQGLRICLEGALEPATGTWNSNHYRGILAASQQGSGLSYDSGNSAQKSGKKVPVRSRHVRQGRKRRESARYRARTRKGCY